MNVKKVPMRTCVVCRTSKPKKELLRIVKYEDKIFVDKTGKANGRGAYVCASETCLEKCIKTKALNRTFKCEIDNSVFESIKKDINKN